MSDSEVTGSRSRPTLVDHMSSVSSSLGLALDYIMTLVRCR